MQEYFKKFKGNAVKTQVYFGIPKDLKLTHIGKVLKKDHRKHISSKTLRMTLSHFVPTYTYLYPTFPQITESGIKSISTGVKFLYEQLVLRHLHNP